MGKADATEEAPSSLFRSGDSKVEGAEETRSNPDCSLEIASLVGTRSVTSSSQSIAATSEFVSML